MSGVQTAITAFTLTMAALMIPGSKLTDIWGRKFCFRLGLLVYCGGAIVAALSQGLPVLILGYSLGQGIGTALLIPPVYILATVFYDDIQARARAFGAISAAGGIGSAAGPLIGGLITSAATWRLAFRVQALIALLILYLARRIADPGVQGEKPSFDLARSGPVGSGLFFVVVGILQAATYGWFTSTPGLHHRLDRPDSYGRHLTGLGVRPDRRAAARLVLPPYWLHGTRWQGATAGDPHVQEPREQPGPQRPRSSSGWCCSAYHSSSRCTCKRCAATARSRQV